MWMCRCGEGLHRCVWMGVHGYALVGVGVGVPMFSFTYFDLVASLLCRTHFKVPAVLPLKPGKGKKKKNKTLHNGGSNSQP